MNDAARPGQALHEQTGATSVIEMNVCQENIIDVDGIQALLPQGVEQQRNAVVGAGIHECATPLLDNQVARILNRAQIFRVDGDNAIV
jgi:hypothetical protein